MGRYIVANILRAHGISVEIHDDHFVPTEEDTVWTRSVGARGWVVLSKDNNIRKRELERRAMIEANVSAFWLGRADISGAEIAAIFRAAIPKINSALDSASGPVRGIIHRDATIVLLDDNLSVPSSRGGHQPIEDDEGDDFGL